MIELYVFFSIYLFTCIGLILVLISFAVREYWVIGEVFIFFDLDYLAKVGVICFLHVLQWHVFSPQEQLQCSDELKSSRTVSQAP